MRKYVFLILLNSYAIISVAQSPKETIHGFFKAFNEDNGEKLESYFADKTSMVSTFKDKNDSTIVSFEKVEVFLNAFGNKQGNTWREDVSNIKVDIDGDFAQAWFDYQFYLNDKLNHCGVDAFQMIRVNTEWKIVHLADTRRKDNCRE